LPPTTLPPKPTEENVDDGVPRFPWPPPRSSAQVVLEPAFFAGARSLDEVGARLSRAFRQAGYPRESWYAVPGGFALVSQMEQFSDDGVPREARVRFDHQVAPQRLFSLGDFVRALFTASPGRFRIIVFVYTSVPFPQTGAAIDREAAGAWLAGGLNVLPPQIGARAPNPDHRCTALVYEFEKASSRADARLKDPSALSGEQHLKRAGLWDPLTRP
jgi:ADP-ribose pyrophosphatase YjhB (NUDIX family)